MRTEFTRPARTRRVGPFLEIGPKGERSFLVRLTDLAVSCKAAHCTTQPAGPGARRRPSTDSRTGLTEGQGAVRADLTAAPPSWAAYRLSGEPR